MVLEGGKKRSIRLSIDPGAETRDVLGALGAIEPPRTAPGAEALRCAVFELISNSLRAHRDRGIRKQVALDVYDAESKLLVQIRDFGGGFDPRHLPLSLEDDVKAMDVLAEPLMDYQRRNDFKRFGMGLHIAKKTFEGFQILFLDEKGSPGPWNPQTTAGTLIRLSIHSEPGKEDGQKRQMPGPEQRRHRRVRGYAKVVFRRNAAPGYIRDLSESGCKVDFLRTLPVARGDPMELEVIPERELEISPFKLCLKTQWASTGPLFFSLGGRREPSLNPETEESYRRLDRYWNHQ